MEGVVGDVDHVVIGCVGTGIGLVDEVVQSSRVDEAGHLVHLGDESSGTGRRRKVSTVSDSVGTVEASMPLLVIRTIHAFRKIFPILGDALSHFFLGGLGSLLGRCCFGALGCLLGFGGVNDHWI